ncbi:MAG: GFA family protein, partial [Pseudomonadota bacterium]
MAYTGRCACTAVTLEIAGEPVGTRQCWCRQCQTIAAGGPTHNAIFPAESVTIAGALAASTWTAASGNTLAFHFCPSCGTQVYAQSSARPHLKTVRFGVINQPHDL